MDTRLGRERREGLGRDEKVESEKRFEKRVFCRLVLVSFRLTATFANALASDLILDDPQEKRWTASR